MPERSALRSSSGPPPPPPPPAVAPAPAALAPRGRAALTPSAPTFPTAEPSPRFPAVPVRVPAAGSVPRVDADCKSPPSSSPSLDPDFAPQGLPPVSSDMTEPTTSAPASPPPVAPPPSTPVRLCPLVGPRATLRAVGTLTLPHRDMLTLSTLPALPRRLPPPSSRTRTWSSGSGSRSP